MGRREGGREGEGRKVTCGINIVCVYYKSQKKEELFVAQPDTCLRLLFYHVHLLTVVVLSCSFVDCCCSITIIC